MQGIYPRKGFGYYLLGTTCLTGQLAVVSYGLLTVLEPMAAAAAFASGIFLTLRSMLQTQKLVDENSMAVVPDHIQKVFNHLARKAKVPNVKIESGEKCQIAFDHITNRYKVFLSAETITSDGPYNTYEVASIIGHELGHFHYSRHTAVTQEVIRSTAGLGEIGLGIAAICAFLIAPAGSTTGFLSDYFTLIAANLVGGCIYNRFNQLIEKKCDQYSAVLTGCPDAMSSALKKIINAKRPHNEETWALTRTGDERPLLRALMLLAPHPSLVARSRSIHQFVAGIDPQVLEQSRHQIAAFVPNPNSQ